MMSEPPPTSLAAPIPIAKPRSRFPAYLACGFLLAIFTVTGDLAWSNKGPTFDEPLHFLGALVQKDDFDFRVNPEDPPLWKYLAAGGVNDDNLVIDRASPRWDGMLQYVGTWLSFSKLTMFEQRTANVDALINAGRQRMMLLGIALGAMIGWWSWRLAGPLAAFVAIAAFALDPNFLAHATLVKDDVAITLAFLCLMASIWLLGEHATILRFIGVTLALGIALTTKFSGVLGVVFLIVALLILALLPQPWKIPGHIVTTRSRRLLAAGVIAFASCIFSIALIWAAYGFRFSPGPNGSKLFDISGFMQLCAQRQALLAHGAPVEVKLSVLDQWSRDWHPTPVPRLIAWMNLHHLLPQAWLMGFFYTYITSLTRAAFLCGQVRLNGWWYFFPISMAVKTPLATIFALCVSAISLAWWKPNWKIRFPMLAALAAGAFVVPILLRPLFAPGVREYLPIYSCVMLALLLAALIGIAFWLVKSELRNAWPLCVAAICPVVYLAFAMHSNLNMGIRHVLPIYPYLFIFLGVAAAQARRRWPRAGTVLIGIFILGLGVESFSVFPDYIPFFNFAAGGSRGGIHLLGNSDLDWGEELPTLARWQIQHQQPDQQLYLSYFGFGDPRYYDLRYINLPGSMADDDQPPVPSRLTPIFAISAPMLQGDFTQHVLSEYYEPFRNIEPFEILGGTIYLFHAPPHWGQIPAKEADKNSP